MKSLVPFSRLVVGILFIFSGFIKLNDPLGFSYKLEEYFSEAVLDLEFLIPWALTLSEVIVVVEVLLGIMLLIGFMVRFTVISLLLMTLFFTFLTFYSAYFNKVTDCGCFGDAIPLTPWQSFCKDVILLALILILAWGRNYIFPLFKDHVALGMTFLSLLACGLFANHVLHHLPSLDFRPYKVGANLPDGMVVPEGAPGPVMEVRWKFLVNGEEQVIATDGHYPEVDGELLGAESELIDEGYVPPIHDFSIEKDGEDHTEEMMQEERLILMVAYNLIKSDTEGFSSVQDALKNAVGQGYRVIGLTASGQEDIEAIRQETGLSFDFYFCDETTLKTMIRSNPGIMVLKKGTVQQKLSWRDAKDLQL